MSDASVDRMGDVIVQNGWGLVNFNANPVAVFSHKAELPLAAWKNVRVKGGKLRGRREFLPQGMSARVDEAHASVEAKMLRAVSVGFRPIDAEPLPNGGVQFERAELVECSVVSIPANPNALAVVKSLNLSDDVQRVIFGEPADEITGVERSVSRGEPASQTPNRKPQIMKTLAERIVDAQN